MNGIKILLADDHPLIRKGFKSILKTLGLAQEILEADDGKQALELSLKNQIDLFILDYRMPEMGGYDTAKVLLKRNRKTKVVIITAYSDTDLISNMLNIGVKGFLSKNTDVDEIQFAIHHVLAGQIYLNKILEDRMLRELNFSKKNTPPPLSFTNRENDVISLLSKGKTSKDISKHLGLSQKTIETYRSRLLDKVGVKNSTELMNYFHSNGLIW